MATESISLVHVAALVLAVAGGVFLLVCALTSLLRFERHAERAAADAKAGALTADGLEMLVAARIARRRERPFGLALLGADAGAEALRRARDGLRAALRAGDEVALDGAGGVAVLWEAPREATAAVLGRVVRIAAEALPAAPETLRVGWTQPETGADLPARDVVEAARKARDEAGRGARRIVPEPPPAAAAGGPEADEAALLDPETGVLKPALIARMMQRGLERNRRGRAPSAVLVVGTPDGKPAPRALADLLQRELRHDDLIGRADEETLAALLAADAAGAAAAAARLVARAAAESPPRALCAGVAAFPAHGREAEVLLRAAHAAWRQAGRGGALHVLTFDASMGTEGDEKGGKVE